MNAFLSRQVEDGDRIIIPVYHGVTQADVVKSQPLVASVVSYDTSKLDAASIAGEIARLVQRSRPAGSGPAPDVQPQPGVTRHPGLRRTLGTRVLRRTVY